MISSKYTTERLMAPSRDGTLIPVSVVYRRNFVKHGSGPLHIQGYGAYGYAVPPGFSANRLSLLDRGFACAIAHIRGGDDLGYRWYLDGKLEKRTNTFNDFVDATRFLIAQASPSRAVSRRQGARPAASSWARSPARRQNFTARLPRTFPSWTCSTPCSMARCR